MNVYLFFSEEWTKIINLLIRDFLIQTGNLKGCDSEKGNFVFR